MAMGPKELSKFYPKRPGEAITPAGRTVSAHKARDEAEDDADAGAEMSPGDTQIWTIFTEPGGTHEIYSPGTWVRCRLILTTAGPVVVGNQDKLDPVDAGKGILLPQNTPVDFALGRGAKLFYAADAVNRIGVIIEPIPWLREIARATGSIPRRLAGALRSLRGGR